MRVTLPLSVLLAPSLGGRSFDFEAQWPITLYEDIIFVDKIVIGGPALEAGVVTRLRLEESSTMRKFFDGTITQLAALYSVAGVASRLTLGLETATSRGAQFVLQIATLHHQDQPTDQMLVASDVLQQQGIKLSGRELTALLPNRWELHAALEVLVGEAAARRMSR